MKPNKTNTQDTLSKTLSLSGISFCALLCTLSIFGPALGLGLLTTAAAYFESIGSAMLVLSIGALGIWLYRKGKVNGSNSVRKSNSSCGINCGCKRRSQKSGSSF